MLTAVGNHLWQSTLFGGGIALLAILLKSNRAAVRYRLWLAASLKFLLPFSFLVTLGSGFEWRNPPVSVTSRVFGVDWASNPFPSTPPEPLRFTPPQPSRLPRILFGLWLCGFLANGLAWWRRWRRLRSALRAAQAMTVGWPVRAKSTPARLEPGVFGVLRPFLLLPEGITEKLSPPQFEAVIEHELCHIDRRDNLAAAVHMLVEALFWFHPLVWWIEARMVEERERACDEAVVRKGCDPQDYAEGILNVAKFYLESPLVCVAGVTGANLTKRIEAIMRNSGVQSLDWSRRVVLAATGLTAVAIPFGLGVFNAPEIRAQQMFRSNLAFETASIHSVVVDPKVLYHAPLIADLSRLGPTNLGGTFGNEFLMPIGTVKSLIMDAYDIQASQIDGLPLWTGAELYAINATASGDAAPAQEQVRVMLQNLLAVRFHLRAHKETRDIASYDLTVTEGAGNIKPAAEGAAEAEPWWVIRGIIKLCVDRPVVDKTGFTGRVYAPRWLLEWTTPRRVLFDQVQQLYGVKLTPVNIPTDFIVVDDVERPGED